VNPAGEEWDSARRGSPDRVTKYGPQPKGRDSRIPHQKKVLLGKREGNSRESGRLGGAGDRSENGTVQP